MGEEYSKRSKEGNCVHISDRKNWNRPIGISSHWWENIIKICLKEMVRVGMYWLLLVHDRGNWTWPLTSEQDFFITLLNIWVPYNVGNFLNRRATVSFFKDSGPWRDWFQYVGLKCFEFNSVTVQKLLKELMPSERRMCSGRQIMLVG